MIDNINLDIIKTAQTFNLPLAVIASLEEICVKLPWMELDAHIKGLTNITTAPKALEAIKNTTKLYEQKGLELLCVYLAAAQITKNNYERNGIPYNIFTDTMSCFSRYINETFSITNEWCFDRAFWTYRQLSCVLFKLGALEFEYMNSEIELCASDTQIKKGTPIISVHIPSDIKITREALNSSYKAAYSFFASAKSFIPTFNGSAKALYCGTWLLAPQLLKLLDEKSSIRLFAEDYIIIIEDKENKSYMKWLFKTDESTPLNDLCESTSLQRKAKQHLLAGGKLGEGHAIYKGAFV